MKNLLIFILFSVLHFVGIAQCENEIFGKNVEIGMFLHTHPVDQVDKNYVAEVTYVNGDKFSCRFLHSNSIYEFENLKIKPGGSATMLATVKSSKGGRYAAGTVFSLNFFMADPDDCDLSGSTEKKPYTIIVRFQDNKSYLGRGAKTDSGYTIQFGHTNSKYYTDKDFKVLSTQGGGYAIGSQMKVVHARVLRFNTSVDTIGRN